MSDPSQSHPVVEVRLRVPWLPVIALGLFVIQQFFPTKTLMALSLITGGMWLFGYLWARSLAAGLRLERHRKYGWSQVGDVFEEKVVLKNGGIFPALWLLIVDGSTLVGHSISLGTGIEGLASRHWTKRTACSQRGEYQLGPTSIETGDLFGLYRVRIGYPDCSAFVVSPPVIKLPMDVRISSGRLLHDHRFANRRTEVSTVSASTREFAPGDTLLRIHWLTTARRGHPFVRQFENIHASNSCWIVLDLDAGVHETVGEHNSLENSIILAVSLANRFLKDGLAVGVLAQGDRALLIPPAKGSNQFRRIQRMFATIQAGDLPFRDLLLQAWTSLQNEHNLVIVTPSRQPEWLESLTQMRRADLRPTVFLLNTSRESEEGGAGFGRLVSRFGIDSFSIPPEIFNSIETAPGKQGVIEWRFTPLGRAIKVIGGDIQ